MFWDFILDGIFAAIAAIGFSAISRPARRAYKYVALIAGVGHSFRFLLLQMWGWHIVSASFIASLLIGLLSVLLSPRTKIPPETYLYPALLPMIPGIYAYKTFGAMVMCLINQGNDMFMHYFALLAGNGLTCFFILLAMVVGATLPMFIFSKISFQATRQRLEL